MALYQELAATGAASASLYWNWAQAARARGALGEALWALLRARELEPGDRAVVRDIEQVRADASLDPAEIAPEPLAAAARFGRRFRLDTLAVLFAVVSLIAHLLVRYRRPPWARSVAWAAGGLALACAVAPLAGGLARPTGVVVRRGAPLLEAASPTADATGTLREGEVVPILDASGGYVRIEDSSGARGWARAEDVRRL
jgi:hypothetical protein